MLLNRHVKKGKIMKHLYKTTSKNSLREKTAMHLSVFSCRNMVFRGCHKFLCLIIISVSLLSGCLYPVEKIGVSDDDPRIEFETFEKGFTKLESNNYIALKSGYDDEVIINDRKDLEELENELGVDFSKDIDFDEYMLYVTFSGNFGKMSKLSSYDINEIAYNDDIIVVIISYDNSETIEAENGEWLCFYNISKIKKSDFPYESRDYLCVPDKGNNN